MTEGATGYRDGVSGKVAADANRLEHSRTCLVKWGAFRKAAHEVLELWGADCSRAGQGIDSGFPPREMGAPGRF